MNLTTITLINKKNTNIKKNIAFSISNSIFNLALNLTFIETFVVITLSINYINLII